MKTNDSSFDQKTVIAGHAHDVVGAASIAAGFAELVSNKTNDPHARLMLNDAAAAVLRCVEPARALTQCAKHGTPNQVASLAAELAPQLFRDSNTAIRLLAHLLRTNPSLQPHREKLLTAERAAHRCAALVGDLLVCNRGESAAQRECDLGPVIQAAVDVLRHTLPSNIQFQTRIAPDLWPIRAVPRQIDRLVTNLFKNAYDAMPQGGILTVAACNVAGVTNERGPLTENGPGIRRFVLVEVADTGCGIPAEHWESVLRPFFTTKQPGRGTGLGLAIVQWIVAKHDGFVAFQSEVGQGTRFFVYLPA
ncbi:MAG: HAMP domain-containing sensor histidine kinase [Verrucomicrobia bacterium]|nr:HAMP domain-containing sensor histidine kinase [Verrucomicrobiota bacterium]